MNRFEFNTGDHKEEEEKVLVGRSLTKKCILNIAICRQGFRDWKSWEFLMV